MSKTDSISENKSNKSVEQDFFDEFIQPSLTDDFDNSQLTVSSDYVLEKLNLDISLLQDSNDSHSESAVEFFGDAEKSFDEITERLEKADETDEKPRAIEPTPSAPHSNSTRVKVKRYLPAFKDKVVSFALENSVKEAVRVYKVNKSTVSDWIRNEPKRRENITRKTEKKPDLSFINWISTERRQETAITKESILSKVEELCKLSDRNESSRSSLWFFDYADRLMGEPGSSKIRVMYPLTFKKEIAFLAKKYSKKSLSKTFGIDRKRIFNWAEFHSKEIPELPAKRDASHYLTDNKIDESVWEWYEKQSSKPNGKQVRDKALALYKQAGYTAMTCSPGWYYRWRKRYTLPNVTTEKRSLDDQLLFWVLKEYDNHRSVSRAQLLAQACVLRGTKFKPSSSWAIRFSRRYSSMLRGNYDLKATFPEDVERAVLDFKQNLSNKISGKSNVIFFGEAPLNFLSTPKASQKTQSLLRKSEFENCIAIIIITCCADGSFLPSHLIVKAPVHLEENCDDCTVSVQKSLIIDESTIQEWFSRIALKLPSSAFVVCDSYEPHLSIAKNFERQLKEKDIQLSTLPLGCSLKLQPVLRIAEAFKDEVKLFWEKWHLERSWSSSSGVPMPSEDDVFKWVVQAHRKISGEKKEWIHDLCSRMYALP